MFGRTQTNERRPGIFLNSVNGGYFRHALRMPSCATVDEDTVPSSVGRTDISLRQGEQDAVERFLCAPGEESFRDVFHTMAPRVVCYLRSRGCGRELAEDLTQEVMSAVYNQSRRLRKKELFRPWLFKIVKHALLQHLRRTGREVATVALDPGLHEPTGVPVDPLIESRFNQWMAWLEPDEQQIMRLRYVEELEYHEIAEVLEIPIGTVQWKVFHSKRKLEARFGDNTR